MAVRISFALFARAIGENVVFTAALNTRYQPTFKIFNFQTVEEHEKASKKEFAPGYKTSSEWLVQHERFVAFSKKYVNAKNLHVRIVRSSFDSVG